MVHTQEAVLAVELVGTLDLVGADIAITEMMDPLLQPLPALVVQVAVVRARPRRLLPNLPHLLLMAEMTTNGGVGGQCTP